MSLPTMMFAVAWAVAWAVAMLALLIALGGNRVALRRIRFLEQLVEDLSPVCCRVCGCTEAEACLGGCWWVEGDLCSSCADDIALRSLDGDR